MSGRLASITIIRTYVHWMGNMELPVMLAEGSQFEVGVDIGGTFTDVVVATDDERHVVDLKDPVLAGRPECSDADGRQQVPGNRARDRTGCCPASGAGHHGRHQRRARTLRGESRSLDDVRNSRESSRSDVRTAPSSMICL